MSADKTRSFTGDLSHDLDLIADVLATSHRWLAREAEIMRDDSDPDWVGLMVETRELATCLANMGNTVDLLRHVAEWGRSRA